VSGIVALLRRDGRPATAADVAAPLASLAHRGAAGGGVHLDGPAAVACAQRRVTPQAASETLPFRDAARRVVVVHDARLDNRAELAAALGLRDRPLAAVSDSEILAAAWTRWGESCPERMLGDFAFALWDERRRTVFCARDHLGTRVLFCWVSPELFACASEIKGLLAAPGVDRRLDPAHVADYLIGVVPDVASTFHAGIVRLRPGESRTATAEAVGARRYYRLTLPERVHRGTPEEVAAGFRDVLAAAVRRRLAATPPVGAQLSGGLDSSSLVCLARRERDAGAQPLPTFSYVFPRTPAADERAYIEAVVAEGGVEPHFIDADAISPLTALDEALAALDEPFRGAPLPYQWELFRRAAGLGVGVMLDGFGGDSVVGYGLWSLADLARSGRFLRLAREVRGIARTGWLSPRDTLRQFVLEPGIPRWLLAARRAVKGRTARLPASTLVAPELARRTALADRFEAFWHATPPPRGDREHHLLDVELHLPGDLIERVGRGCGIEPRFPYLDRDVVEYCLAVPPAHKLENGVTRMLARRALAGVLTPAVAARTGKATPTTSLIRTLLEIDGPLLDELLLGPPAQRASPYIDVDAVRRLYRERRADLRAAVGSWPSTTTWRIADELRTAAVLVRWLEATGVSE